MVIIKISQLYCYPVKSLRGVRLNTVEVTPSGFPYDRRFMLLKVKPNGSLENMQVKTKPEMALFKQELFYHPDGDNVRVTFQAPGNPEEFHIDIPMQPPIRDLETVDISIYKSGATVFKMDSEYSDWFSTHFGYNVILVYMGTSSRPVVSNLDPGFNDSTTLKNLPLVGSYFNHEERINFADAAAYLVVSEESNKQVSTNFPDGEEMDIIKFRPSIVVSGASEAWDEDYWGAIQVSSDDPVEFTLTGNCGRCPAITVDHETGKYSTGAAGQILKTLLKYRKVDAGQMGPIFGRYAFLSGAVLGKTGATISVGDEVVLTKRKAERTVKVKKQT